MTRCLCAISKDFGEYVTANLFTRRQPFDATIVVPRALERYARGRAGIIAYETLEQLDRLVRRTSPEVVVLCSAYLFSINGLIAPQALTGWICALRERGIAVATTDPWLRIWAFEPNARFTLHSVRTGGVDTVASERVMKLQAFLEGELRALPHLVAVPLGRRNEPWLPFFNTAFAEAARSGPAPDAETWLFVMSGEDYVFLKGFGGDAFFNQLEARLNEVASNPRNRIAFVGPPELGARLAPGASRWPSFEYLPFCDFATFERLIERAAVAVYWNALSSSLLYCLYRGVPPIFFGEGHQARVLPSLYGHAVTQVYAGHAPTVLDMGEPLEREVSALHRRYDLHGWLARVRSAYEALPEPASVMTRLLEAHGAA